jgi:adenylylsulfate kinase
MAIQTQAAPAGFTVWITGMLGAGKTTIADYVAARLRQVGRPVEVLDEDDVVDLMFEELEEETKENRVAIARRIGILAEMLTRQNVCTLVACTSPYKAVREENRRRIGRYIEVFADSPTEDLIKRDSSGKYKKALHGEIPNFVGITEPYEPPTGPEVTIATNVESVEEGGLKVFQALLDLAYVTSDELRTITGTSMRPSKGGAKGNKKSKASPARTQKVTKPAKVAPKKAKPSKKKR